MQIQRQFDRKAPAFVERALRKFGKNPYGEPVYRVVWSEGETETVGGVWHDHLDPNQASGALVFDGMMREENPEVGQRAEYRRVQRYPQKQRWLLTKWLPPAYSREEFHERFTDAQSGLSVLGPYEERGDYHLCYELSFRGDFMPLSVSVIEYYCRLIEHGKEYSQTQRRLAIEDRLARQKRDYDNRFDAIFDDAQLAGGTQNLFCGQRGPKSADRTKPEDVSFGDTKDLPSWVPREAGFRQI